MACASTVAVVVPSPAVSLVFLATSRTSWAPMFSYGFLSSTSLATVTPSLVIVGAPNFLSRIALRPFGPSVAFTASASWFTPLRMDARAASPYISCFAMVFPPYRLSIAVVVYRCVELAGEDPQDVFFLEDQTFFVFDPELAAGIFVEQDLVADFHMLNLLADSLDDASLRLLFRAVRHVNPAGGPVQFLGVGDEYPVTQRLEPLG